MFSLGRLVGACRVYEGYPESVWKVSGGCLEGVLKVSGRCSERCLGGVWKMFDG